MSQIEEWELVDIYRNSYEDLAYNDKTVNEGERVIGDELLVSFLNASCSSDQVRGGYLIDDKGFAGIVILNDDTTSYGMSVSENSGLGVLLTDGTGIGKTQYHYFHCSTEISESRDSVYELRKKA